MTASQEPSERPLLLSFFCAGTPSQNATDDLARELAGADTSEVRSLRYRGCGWPGDFTVATQDGEYRTDYRTSWGDKLGPSMQWRCKICPDGVGESADLAACDYWETDDKGYPLFEEGDGRSGLLVRTERGREVLHAALEAGVLVGEPLDAGRIAAVQPGQTWRRDNLAARLIGARLAGAPTPAYKGFPLLRLAFGNLRQSFRSARGSWRRARASGLGR
jgi:coenzyme F420 hydrogenase subunit beta